ncbi:MlaD family protein [Nocardia asteroides]|uniref:MlaD family protein n=1 Tax=Nocardia asteroides TaxID=1824 RepID=UPI001E626695|nr:MlaD family protein [Nocardia asteroides]UGT53848.1 MlaD family protein [Nocardia asteroides]
MLKRLLGSQAFMSIAGVAVLVALVIGGYFVAFDPLKKTESYCALMPDAIGLYPGNHVTMRGIDVGEVTAVRNEGPKVRVEFEVDAEYPVYADASATTVAYSVAADRNLAVLASGANTERLSGGCITKTLTPKSITETLTALASLSEQLSGAEAGQPSALVDGLASLDRATVGTGPTINELVHKLGSAMNQPDADIGHLAGLFDAFASVSNRVAANWGDLQTMLVRLAPLLNQASDDLLGPATSLFDGLRELLPMLNDFTTILGDPLIGALDGAVPLVKLLRANIGSLREVVLKMPALTSAFQSVAGGTAITYAPPKVALPTAEADQVCGALNALVPGQCPDPAAGLTDVNLVQVVLGMAGAR